MKIKIKENFIKEIEIKELKKFLELWGYKGEFSYKVINECPCLEIKFKEKIEKNIKNLIPFVVKGEIYKKFLEKKGIFFKCYLIGMDSIVLPRDSGILEEILKIEEIIPHEGLKKGLEAYLKLKKTDKIHYLLALNLKEKDLKKFIPLLFACLFKDFAIGAIEIEELKGFYFFIFTLKELPKNFLPLPFTIYFENFAKTIYVEKNLQNKL